MEVRKRMKFELFPGIRFPNPPPGQPPAHQSAAGRRLLKGKRLQSGAEAAAAEW